MKRPFFVILTLIFVFSIAANVFAGGSAPVEPVPFEIISSELDDFQPENEYSITFSKTITINAETIKGASVTVSVSGGAGSEPAITVYEPVTVGATLKFIQPVALSLGDNLIVITVEKEGYESVVKEALVKRKDRNIMESLQNLIIIPGLAK